MSISSASQTFWVFFAFFLQLVSLSDVSSKSTLLPVQNSGQVHEETESSYVFLLLPSSPRRPELPHCLTF